jgi:hypothetical protein
LLNQANIICRGMNPAAMYGKGVKMPYYLIIIHDACFFLAQRFTAGWITDAHARYGRLILPQHHSLRDKSAAMYGKGVKTPTTSSAAE